MRLLYQKSVICALIVCLVLLSTPPKHADAAVVSCYGSELAGSPTASGVPFDPQALTMAHRTLPFGTKVLLTHAGNGVIVTVNDRGPYVGDRWGDLSCGAMAALGLPVGVHDVKARVL